MMSDLTSLPDEADVCLAIERAVEFWARHRRAQGSKPPGCTPASTVQYLYRPSIGRVYRHLAKLAARGLVRKVQFETSGPGWKLTAAGSRLAADGVLRCNECLDPVPPELWPVENYDRCAACLAALLEDKAQRHETWARTSEAEAAAEHREAEKLRTRAEEAWGLVVR